jgi:hypothetical protein
VTLTAAGQAVLADTRTLLDRADNLRRLPAGLASSDPVRLGYVNRWPADRVARTSGVAQLHVDAWVAHDTGARRERIDDGGVTGRGFFDHVRRLRRPVVNSPKGQTTPLPPHLVQRAIVDPTPLWTWWLVSRSGATRAAIRASVEAPTRHVRTPGLGDPGTWVPVADPYRPVATTP